MHINKHIKNICIYFFIFLQIWAHLNGCTVSHISNNFRLSLGSVFQNLWKSKKFLVSYTNKVYIVFSIRCIHGIYLIVVNIYFILQESYDKNTRLAWNWKEEHEGKAWQLSATLLCSAIFFFTGYNNIMYISYIFYISFVCY